MRNFLEELDIKGEYYYYNLSEEDADLKIKDWMLNIFDNLKNVLNQCTEVCEINEKVKCYLFNILSDDDYEKCLKNIRILFFDNKYLDYIEKIVIEVFSEDGHGVKYMFLNDLAPNDRCLRIELFDLEHEDDNTIYLVSPDHHGCLNLMRKIDEIVIDITDGKTVEQKNKLNNFLLNIINDINNGKNCKPVELDIEKIFNIKS